MDSVMIYFVSCNIRLTLRKHKSVLNIYDRFKNILYVTKLFNFEQFVAARTLNQYLNKFFPHNTDFLLNY